MNHKSRAEIQNEMRHFFISKFKDASIDGKFLFIYKYLSLIENVDTINLFYKTDPLKQESNYVIDMEPKETEPNDTEPNDMESEIVQFLTHMTECSEGSYFTDTPHAQAYAFLGMVHEIGAFGIPLDSNKAHVFYKNSAKQKSSFGTYRLAHTYEKNNKNGKAIAFYRCAAKLGGVEALHTYGYFLIYGVGVTRDIESGVYYLRMATGLASKHYPYPYFDLAQVHEDGNLMMPDGEYAFALYMQGAQLGDVNCIYRVGKCYEFGELGVEIDMQKAIQYYLCACEGRQVDGMHRIAQYMAVGVKDVLEKNEKRAYALALCSASKGSSGAAFTLGGFIERGVGIGIDLLHSLWWYNVAYFMGENKAKDKCEELRRCIMKNSTGKSSQSGCRLI